MKKISIIFLCAALLGGCFNNAEAASKSKKKKKDKVEVLAAPATPAPIVLTLPAKDALNGEWTMLTLKNKNVFTTERVYLIYDFSQHVFYGCNGCNIVNGKFQATDNGTLKMTDMVTTNNSCHNVTSERSIMKVITETTGFRVTEDNGVRHLQLLDAHGKTLATLKNNELDFLNGAWTVKKIDEEDVTDDNVRLVIDIEEEKLHGNTGCNIVNGDIYIDKAKNWAIEFQRLISTRKMCENMNVETALLVALEETASCRKVNDNEVVLYDEEAKPVVTLIRLNIEKR